MSKDSDERGKFMRALEQFNTEIETRKKIKPESAANNAFIQAAKSLRTELNLVTERDTSQLQKATILLNDCTKILKDPVDPAPKIAVAQTANDPGTPKRQGNAIKKFLGAAALVAGLTLIVAGIVNLAMGNPMGVALIAVGAGAAKKGYDLYKANRPNMGPLPNTPIMPKHHAPLTTEILEQRTIQLKDKLSNFVREARVKDHTDSSTTIPRK